MKEKEKVTQEKFEQIESFLLNKMTVEERQDFEAKIERDHVLADEVQTQRKLMIAVETAGMKNQLNRIHRKITERKNIYQWLMVAASIAVLVAVGFWLVNKPDTADRLFVANVTIEPGLPVPMSATDNYVFYDAMVDYKTGKYELAISKWNPILAANPENDTLNYFVGTAFFNDKKYQQAIPYFENVELEKNSTFLGKSEWYMALSFLKTKDFDRLKILAKESQSDYAGHINQLVQKLE